MYNSMKMLISFKTVVKHHHDMDTVPCDHLKKQITITCLEELYSFKDKVLPQHQSLFFSFCADHAAEKSTNDILKWIDFMV